MTPEVFDESLWHYRARLYRVMDGDTYYLEVDTGFESRHVIRLRLPRVNCPELGTVEGNDAREWAKTWFSKAAFSTKEYWYLRIRTTKTASRYETYTQDRSLERYIGEVYDLSGRSLSNDLLTVGIGRLLPN